MRAGEGVGEGDDVLVLDDGLRGDAHVGEGGAHSGEEHSIAGGAGDLSVGGVVVDAVRSDDLVEESNLPVLTASANLPSAASADSLLIALLFVILVIEGRRSGVRSQVQSQVNPYLDVGSATFYRAASAEICGGADKMLYPLFYPPMGKFRAFER